MVEGPVAPTNINTDHNGDRFMGEELQKFVTRYAKEGVRMFTGKDGKEGSVKPVRIQQLLDFESEYEEFDDEVEEEVEEEMADIEDDARIREEVLKRKVDHEALVDDDYVASQLADLDGGVARRRRLSEADDFTKMQLDHEVHHHNKRTGAGGRDKQQPPPPQPSDLKRILQEESKIYAGEPWQHTLTIQTPGWYRLCVRANVQTIEVEMEFRKSSIYGKIDPKTGHVPFMEEMEIHTEIHDLYKKGNHDPEIQGAIKDEDLKVTFEQLRVLERVYQDIIAKQLEERRVWHWRTLKNQHSYSHMVLGNLLETVMYMVITGFQIYTVRKWFGAGPALGR